MCFIEQILFKFLYPKQFFFLLGQLRNVLISCIPVYGWLNPFCFFSIIHQNIIYMISDKIKTWKNTPFQQHNQAVIQLSIDFMRFDRSIFKFNKKPFAINIFI